MNKTLLIFKHEFITMIRRAGFIIMTVAFPLIGLVAIAGGQIFSGLGGEPGPVTEVQIGYVDSAGLVEGYQEQGDIQFVPFDTLDEANGAMIEGDIAEYIFIDASYFETGAVARFTLSRELERRVIDLQPPVTSSSITFWPRTSTRRYSTGPKRRSTCPTS